MTQAGGQAYYEPIQRRFDFAYTTIQKLRDEGIIGQTVTTARAKMLIRQASQTVNRVTGQWFIPIESTERITVPNKQAAIHVDNMVPIIEVRSLKIDSGGQDATQTLVEVYKYRIDDRFIQLTATETTNLGTFVFEKKSRFSQGVRNYIIDGTFGWLQRRVFSDLGDRKLSTTTIGAISEDDTLVGVADSSGFRVGDSVIFRSGNASTSFGAHRIITGIGSPNELEFDPITLTQALPVGSTVITYGQVPEEVEMATALIVNTRKHGVGTSDFEQAQLRSRIKMEQTDNYLYQLSDPRLGQIRNTTGSAEADQLLASYHSPPYLGAV